MITELPEHMVLLTFHTSTAWDYQEGRFRVSAVDWFSADLREWLADQVGEQYRDWTAMLSYHKSPGIVLRAPGKPTGANFWFRDPRRATLFKLTWGGQ